MSSPEGDRGLLELIMRVVNGRNRSSVMVTLIDWKVLRDGIGQLESPLVNICKTTPLHQVVRFPTRFREGNRPSLLDLAFIHKPENVRNIDCLPPLGKSPHRVWNRTSPKRIHEPQESLDPNKGPGPDSLHPVILKTLAHFMTEPLTALFNQSLSTSEIPEVWREAIVCPIR